MSGRTGGARYTGQTKGWIVSCSRTFPSAKTGQPVTHVAYWYGPRHGWGTTTGPLGGQVVVFPTKGDAEDALRSVFGKPSGWRGRGYEPVRLAAPRGVTPSST